MGALPARPAFVPRIAIAFFLVYLCFWGRGLPGVAGDRRQTKCVCLIGWSCLGVRTGLLAD